MSPTTLLRLRPTALVSFVVALGALASVAQAQPRSFTDTGAGIAVANGTIVAGEYAGSTDGVNMGFGGLLGAGTRMHMDSDAAGNLALALEDTATCSLDAVNDAIVIYIDSRAGGVASTAALTDIGDAGRAAVSGRGTDGIGVAELTFAPGFTADFAIVLRDDSGSLFAIKTGGAHTFVRTLTRAPAALFGAACAREVAGFTTADLGARPGIAIDYVATLLNATNAFRSNEWQGVTTGSSSGNIGPSPFALAAGDFNTFQTYALPAVIAGQKTVVDFTGFAGTGFSPTPSAGQLSSLNWAATGWSNGALTFGGTQTTVNTDYTRGTSAVVVTTGGFYNFSMGTGATTLGIQPGGSDFEPGDVTLTVQNTAGTRLTQVDLSYVVYVRNDQLRGSTFDPSWSSDGVVFIPLPTANLTTPVASDALGFTANTRSVSISGMAVPGGGFFYVRWSSAAAGGSGSRDELALDDIVLRSTFDTCGDGVLDIGEACDAGAANGTTPCGCTTSCTFGASGTACGAAGPELCDAANTCDGAGVCVDRVLAAASPCRPAFGGCDLGESCDGVSNACPPDGHMAAGVVCRASTGPCDVTEVCLGDDDFCPVDGAAADGTACGDGLACNGNETCAAGACAAGTPIACSDGDVCTTDTCTELAGCFSTPIAGCCTLASQCNDGNACTADSCNLATNSCVNTSLAVAELCNGADDDCDGSIDEDFPTVGATCSGGVGACVTSGNVVCAVGGLTTTCNAVPGAPSAELCNGIDDDCDGSVDDSPATVLCANQTGLCSGARTTSCVAAAWLPCANADYEVNDPRFDTVDTVCDGLDNDCSGAADEDFVTTPTTCGVGACASTGTTTCTTGTPGDTCSAGAASAELCNGIDDDCDGSVDDSPATELCANQAGVCAGATKTSCGGVTGWAACNDASYEARDPRFDTVDTVCDGLDNDCGGGVDEDFVSAPTTCGVGACASTGSSGCVTGAVVDSCAAGTPAASDATCNGVDDDCSGAADEDFASAPTTCGVGACASTGTRGCTAGAVVDSCAAGTPAASDGTCNAVDDDCNGAADEDFVSAPTTCGVGACASTGTSSCTAGAVVDSCAAGTPAASDTSCDGVDDDCSGAVDEDFVATPTTCGLGACARTGATSCVTGATVDSCVEGTPGTETCNGIDDDCNDTEDDTGNALCVGAPTGTVCTTVASGTFCGCMADTACGGATSGRICDGATSRCVDGCFGMTRNGCPAGLFCTSMDATTPGVCTTSCAVDAECVAISAARPFCVIAGSIGTCAECRNDASCAARTDGRVACIGPSNTCAACSTADTTRCDATAIGVACLSNGLCGCATDADCATDRECDFGTSQCLPRPLPDAGVPDAGPDTDAGVDTDAGIDTDAGVDTDAGIDTDAGTDVDAGDEMDSGVDIDAGDEMDAGPDVDGGVDLGRADLGADLGRDGSDASVDFPGAVTGGACGCRTAGGPNAGGSGVLWSLGALALLLVATRRRRR